MLLGRIEEHKDDERLHLREEELDASCEEVMQAKEWRHSLLPWD